MPADLSTMEVGWRDAGPRPGVWAELTAARYPSLDDRNTATFAWRDLLVDPGLCGLMPGRSRPTRIDVAGWRLPLIGVLATPLAWHPRLPLVAGLAVREGRAHPWIADLDARTVDLLDEVRAATSLTDRGGAPLAWCADRRLAVLTPGHEPPGHEPPGHDAPAAALRPVIMEAIGPGRIDFLPEVAVLRRHA